MLGKKKKNHPKNKITLQAIGFISVNTTSPELNSSKPWSPLNEVPYILLYILLWGSYDGPTLVLKFGISKGPHHHPPLQFRDTTPGRWQRHRHTAGYRKKDFHALLVEIEIAVPFIKQSGNIYPNFKIPSLIKPCHAHMSTGMFPQNCL